MTGSESFFDALKSKRESQDIEIAEISDFTRIHPRYIEAMEKGDFTVLPNVYIRLFLKSYANFIGADSAKALKDYELHTTGKITQSEEYTNKEAEVTPSSMPPIETEMDSNPQISPKQIASGIGVICAILILLWWAGKVTQEQTENIKSDELKVGVAAESSTGLENETLKPESNITEPSLKSITDQAMNTKTEKQFAALSNQLPLNDNDFLSEKFDTSHTITNFKLSPPYEISVHALEETKLHISEKQGGRTKELINKIVPRNWKKTFLFGSIIQFEFWSSSHISVTLNTKSIDNYLSNGDMAIRGSYEADKSQLYLSYYKR